jgi:uncharacterized protein (DUF952 family)
MIYRIAAIEDWKQAEETGYFQSADLAADGFIHCCSVEQIAKVANAFYTSRTDLVLLEIDESLLDVPVKWEGLPHSSELFPHVYGPIDRQAIVRQMGLQPDSNGHFGLTATF